MLIKAQHLDMTACLSQPELVDLTDCRRRSGQIRWLTQHGWKFDISAKGAIKVARAEFEAKMLSDPHSLRGREEEPDYGALKEAP